MRIAIANWSRQCVGGAETYLQILVPELHRNGHEVAFLSEQDPPAEGEKITLPEGAKAWSVSHLGGDRALAELESWKPDLVYSHGLLDPTFEARIVELSPTVFYAHNYYGTCISGNKRFERPIVKPCSRTFGWGCLVNYYPRRCGGLNPATMWKQYAKQRDRLNLLPKFHGIIVASEHMRAEYLKHGVNSSRVHLIPHPVRRGCDLDEITCGDSSYFTTFGATQSDKESHFTKTDPAVEIDQRPWRLLFAGRMTSLKGGLTLLDSLPLVARSLQCPLQLTFAGDGPDRKLWERHAITIKALHPAVSIQFVGWASEDRLRALFVDSDLLVVPSVWPEPFGLVGPEAGCYGVPAAAFDVGGISDWLIDGINGYLAPGDAPNAGDLAEAIIRCLRDPATYLRLREGALRVAERFVMQRHLHSLLPILEKATARGQGIGPREEIPAAFIDLG
jgi:glycosyltransferase involved in cell wall biosynthesis